MTGPPTEAARLRFAADLAEVPKKFNRADDGTVPAAGEYLEAIGIRR
ncbi:hypothetical protein ACFLIM_13220 [Nonomuraea sp. M3C6]|uniref:Uncharacterized protein n=1 Tax=Nonomuraea marmarensis TaxID=3351344 RepID=A0ABW7AAT6_9ACTN